MGLLLTLVVLLCWCVMIKHGQLVRARAELRRLRRAPPPTPSATGPPGAARWMVQYKEGRSEKTFTTTATTESEAVRKAFSEAQIRFDHIIKVERVP